MKEQQQDQNTFEPAQTPRTASAFRNAREIEAEAKRKEELAERRRQAAAEEAAYQAREEYAKELAEDRLDLIRLKQGLITDEVFQEHTEQKKYTVWERIGNWFYHAKWWLGIAIFCVLLGAFLLYDYLSREDPDLRILILTDQTDLYAQTTAIEDWLKPLCPDYNEDAKIVVQGVSIPVSEANMEKAGNAAASYSTQLLMQFQSALCMLVLTDAEAEPYLAPEEMFVDLEALYPDCVWAEGCRLKLNGTDFAEQLGFSEPLREGTYLALRAPIASMSSQADTETAYEQAKTVMDSIIPMLHAKKGAGEHGETE